MRATVVVHVATAEEKDSMSLRMASSPTKLPGPACSVNNFIATKILTVRRIVSVAASSCRAWTARLPLTTKKRSLSSSPWY